MKKKKVTSEMTKSRDGKNDLIYGEGVAEILPSGLSEFCARTPRVGEIIRQENNFLMVSEQPDDHCLPGCSRVPLSERRGR